MRTIQEIIDNTGGFARLKRRPLRIDLGGHPTLVVQYFGKTGVGASDYLRVMRVEDIDGEISRVFEMSFECDEHGENWRAVVWKPGMRICESWGIWKPLALPKAKRRKNYAKRFRFRFVNLQTPGRFRFRGFFLGFFSFSETLSLSRRSLFR